MNRIIKFRMWNGEAKKYHYDVENVFQCIAQQNVHDKTMETRGHTYPYSHYLDYSEFEEFTGLKDLNGNDVYEGDIVEFTTYEGRGFGKLGIKCKAVVVYGEYNLQDNVLGGSIGFYLKRTNSEYPISIKYWLYSHKALVTGNIHENN